MNSVCAARTGLVDFGGCPRDISSRIAVVMRSAWAMGWGDLLPVRLCPWIPSRSDQSGEAGDRRQPQTATHSIVTELMVNCALPRTTATP